MLPSNEVVNKRPLRVALVFVLFLVILSRFLFFEDLAQIPPLSAAHNNNEKHQLETKSTWTKNFPLPISYPPSHKIHISHVFSSYSTPTSSPAFKEMAIVQLSLIRASQYAFNVSNLSVEFVDATLPDDVSNSPSFATHVDLTSFYLSQNNDDTEKRKIPTVGEYYGIASRLRGEIIVTTNADIGVTEDFYIKVYAWATRQYLSQEAQLHAMRIAAQFFATCMLYKDDDLHQRFCAQDCKNAYINQGGFKELWRPDLVSQVGFWAAQLVLKQQGRKPQKWVESFLTVLSRSVNNGVFAFNSTSSFETQLEEFTPTGPIDLTLASRLENNHFFAGTITRLDFPDPESLQAKKSPEEALDVLLRKLGTSGVIHPGNDCFVMHRAAIERTALGKFYHPSGLRPFGAWVPLLFHTEGIPFRRITSHRNLYSFHVGIGKWGGAKINFRERMSNLPLMTLFLVANFDRIGHGVFQRQFSLAPKACADNLVGWRDHDFCEDFPAYCVGFVRLSCEKYMHVNSRDAILYRSECSKLKNRRLDREMEEPVCSLCNYFLDQRHEARMQCVNRTLPFCTNLAPHACTSL